MKLLSILAIGALAAFVNAAAIDVRSEDTSLVKRKSCKDRMC